MSRLTMVQKLWLTISLLVAGTLLGVYAVSLYAYEKLYVQTIRDTLIQEGRQLSSHHGEGEAAFSRRVEEFDAVSEAQVLYVSNPRDLSACLPFDVQYTSIISEADRQRLLAGEVITKTGYEERFRSSIMGVVIPIVEQKKLVGIIYSYLPLKGIRSMILELGWILAPLAVLLIALAAWVGRKIVLAVTKPLLQMEAVSWKMAKGDFSERIPVSSHDEVGRLAEAFNSMSDALQEEDTQRKEFLANVSHELRTPLSYIKGYSEAILDGVVKQEQQPKFIGLIQKEANRMQRLVHDLLHLAQLEGELFPLHLQPTVFAQLVEDVLASYELKLAEKELRLTMELDPDVIVQADEDRLRQVVHNLLDNAIRYTPAAGSITVELRQEQSMCCLRIADTGVGIAAEHLKRLGERFYRADKARSRQHGGTGLGLAIVKQIVALHEGQLEIQSAAGTGTTVLIRLPLV
ncbi:sensor histidine kinase [Ectobacillus ponti]|uniref:histidine kinase n=1 Tax=Ectobacillus ponti TaxID=2961894 RepID=A0AA42BQI5_9BACI|nr:HAMP domain-containing sensor histidine kinase [Ectobacillus ponti]MCP8968484.1 cell wall metabolism sensor histidine kinase WalK [Ectobacillus ponti]